jgi:type II secretory pathway pseudopilin PulG
MAVLLIVMGISAVWMAASLPKWRTESTREKEAELLFRGQQYVRAMRLYGMKNPGGSATSIDILVTNKYLRRKYKDPITNEDFVPLYGGNRPTAPAGQPNPGNPQQGQNPAGGTPPRSGGPAPAAPTGPGQGGVLQGVASKSTATSILVYNGATHYNEWQFIYVAPPVNQGGPGGTPGGRPGGPATPGGRPGGPAGVNPGGRPGGAPVGGPARPGGPGRGPGGPPINPGRGRGNF